MPATPALALWRRQAPANGRARARLGQSGRSFEEEAALQPVNGHDAHAMSEGDEHEGESYAGGEDGE